MELRGIDAIEPDVALWSAQGIAVDGVEWTGRGRRIATDPKPQGRGDDEQGGDIVERPSQGSTDQGLFQLSAATSSSARAATQ